MSDPTYEKLYGALVADLIIRGQEENEAAKAVYQHVLDAIWPEVVDLLAKILEYEHALEHVVEPASNTGSHPHDSGPCQSCQRLAQSALDGVNRDGFRELITDP